MRKPKRKKINIMIPFVTMADIAFLLLIFLIVTSAVGKRPEVPLRLPDSTQFDKIKQEENVELYVTSKNELFLNKKQYSIIQLRKNLPDNDRCIISADRNADFETIYKIIKLLQDKSYKSISFSVIRKETL